MKRVCLYLLFLGIFLFAIRASLHATVLGDVNNDGKIDLIETIYSLRIVAGISNPLIPTSESEPNNKIDEANPVELGNSVAGKIGANGDSDFYKLYIPQEGVLDISVTSVPDNINMELKLYDSNKAVLKTFVYGDVGESRIHDILLTAGIYYLQLYDYNSNASSQNSYVLKLELDTTDTHELNGSFDKAAPISIGDTVKGCIRPLGDHDFYTFGVSQEGVLDISVTSVPDTINMEMKLYNSDKVALKTFVYGSVGENRIHAILISAGNYYLELYDYNSNASSRNPYVLKLGLDTTDTHELNGSFDKATSISIGDTVNGCIRPLGDHDFYTFHVSQNGVLNISLTSVPDNINMEMKLYNGNKTALKTFAYGDVGENRIFDYSVSAGTYYLELYDHNSNDSSSDHYQLKLTLTP